LHIAAAAAGLAIAGCASISGAPDRTRFEVEAATVLLIEQSGRPAERAAEIVESVDRLQTLLIDQNTTLGDLRNALLRRVAERDLSPGEKALALQVVSRIAEGVELKVGAGHLSPEAIVSLNTVLGWAENMAALYVQD
jgi:hypothetical protein